MSLSSNVLVIGAGAHVPYGFPTSQQLTSAIKKIYADRAKIVLIDSVARQTEYGMSAEAQHKYKLCAIAKDLEIIKYSRSTHAVGNAYDIAIGNSLEDFLRSFCESQVYSLDSYLSKILSASADEKTLEKAYWGRLLIAYLISTHERQTPFGTHGFDWVQFIINQYIKDSPDKFFKNPPKIVTFNYDRFLERSIYTHLIEYHGYSEQDAKSKVDSLPIVHVYGRLGCYTQWDFEDKKSFFIEATQNIQVIGEQRTKESLEKVSSQIWGWLRGCAKVYFIGYGFDDANNKLLLQRLPRDWRDRNGTKVFCTNVGLKQVDRENVVASLGFAPTYLSDAREVSPLELLQGHQPLERL